MNDSRRQTALLFSFLLGLLPIGVGVADAQPPLYRIGAPNPPRRDPRLTTDNGIPGTGSYYYRDYPYPSLREALQQYGFFGRRFRARHCGRGEGSFPASSTSMKGIASEPAA